MTDHYATLGIERTADAAAIVRAWRLAASNYHPDKIVPGMMDSAQDLQVRRDAASVKFHAAREAFNCLSEPQVRAKYDATLDGAADPGLLSEDDFQSVRDVADSERAHLKEKDGRCVMCGTIGGNGEVRVAAAGFWLRRPCPACCKA